MSESRLQYMNNTKKNEGGFTLIELSIVLVIIGLIVGGILTGQDLIKAAEQRATLAQIEKYNTAVNTFRNKYSSMPGDLPEASAVTFGLLALTGASPAGKVGEGDGNGYIEGGASGATAFVGEVPLFFRHLTDANMIDGSFGTLTPGATAGAFAAALDGTLGAATGPSAIGSLFPLAKLGRGNFITAGSAGGVNYFVISGMGKSTFSVSTAGAITAGSTNNLTALESYNMDKKVDDGLPGSGSVFALDAAGNIVTSGITTLSAVAGCVSATAYALNPGSTPACSLRFRFN